MTRMIHYRHYRRYGDYYFQMILVLADHHFVIIQMRLC